MTSRRLQKLQRPEAWRSFQYAMSSDTAYQRVQSKIKTLLTDTLVKPTKSTDDLGGSPKDSTPLTASTESASEFDNAALWEQEEKIIESVRSTGSPVQTHHSLASIKGTASGIMRSLETSPSSLVLATAASSSKRKGTVLNPFSKEKDKKEEASSSDLSPSRSPISWGSFGDLPVEGQREKPITEFDASWYQLTAIPPEIHELTWIQVCNFSHNQLSMIPATLGQLVVLEVLILSENRITSIPSEICELKNLKKLHLDNNRLTSLPSQIKKLDKLELLNLDKNNLTHLPIEMHECPSLVTLSVSENPLYFPPKNIIDKGVGEIRSYLSIISKGERGPRVPPRKINLVLLGPEKCGKTSVLNYLVTKKPFKKSDKNTSSAYTSGTLGLSLGSWTLETKSDESQKIKTNFSTWDFSGQSSLLDLHKHFIASNYPTVYLVAWDMTQDCQSVDIEFWLECLKDCDAPVILVGTHLDDKKFEGNPDLSSELVQLMAQRFETKFGHLIRSIAQTSATLGYGFDYLREQIEKVVLDPMFMDGKEVPQTMFAVEDALAECKKKEAVPVIPWRNFVEIAKRCGVNENELPKAVQRLHQMGSLVYLNSEFIREYAILSPQWLYESIFAALGTKQQETVSESIPSSFSSLLDKYSLTPGYLNLHIWQDYSLEMCSFILATMENFHITIPLPRASSDTLKHKAYNPVDLQRRSIIFNFLMESRPSWFKFEVRQGDDIKRYIRQYQFNFLPESLLASILRSMLDLHYVNTQQTPENFWYNGAVISDANGNSALIEVNQETRLITIISAGSNHPESLLRQIVQTLDLNLSNWFAGLIEVNRYVPCPHCIASSSSKRFDMPKSVGWTQSLPKRDNLPAFLLGHADGSSPSLPRRESSPSVQRKESSPSVQKKESSPSVQRKESPKEASPITGAVDTSTATDQSNTSANSSGQDLVVEPHLFTMEECEVALVTGKQTVKCGKPPNQYVSLKKLIPDLCLLDKDHQRLKYEQLKIVKEIGAGAFGVIYQVQINGKSFAMKEITKTTEEEKVQAFREWYSEVCVMSSLNSGYVVTLRGFVQNPFCIIMEFVPGGNLFDFLKRTDVQFTWNLIVKLASDIANGMAYIHSTHPPLVHRDLKSLNILMGKKDVDPNDIGPVAKVADFGTTTPMLIHALRSRVVDQPLWLAPEVMTRQAYNEKSDVYAFGVILWELIARQLPFDEFPFAQWPAQLEDRILVGTRPTIPDCIPAYRKLIHDCWQFNPELRPTFSTVVRKLKSIQDKLRSDQEKNARKSLFSSMVQGYPFDLPDTPDTIIRADLRSTLQQASLIKLIENITASKDHDILTDVALTCSLFCGENDFLRLLKLRYTGPKDSKDSSESQITAFNRGKQMIQSRVLELLLAWTKCAQLPPDILNSVSLFVPEQKRTLSGYGSLKFTTTEKKMRRPSLAVESKFDLINHKPSQDDIQRHPRSYSAPVPASEEMMEHKLAQTVKKKLTKKSTALSLLQRRVSQGGKDAGEQLSSLDPRVIAEQMTLIESLFLQSVHPSELIKMVNARLHFQFGSFKRTVKERSTTNNLQSYIEWFIQARNWAITEILKGESCSERAAIIDKFIQVAVILQELKNYNGIMTILACLHSEAVTGLLLSWMEVPGRSLEFLQSLSFLMAPLKDYKAYRQTTKDYVANKTTFIPFLGVILKDLAEIDELMQWKERDLINVEKIRKTAEIIKDFKHIQKQIKKLQLTPQPRIRAYILQAEIWDENDYQRIAQLREDYDQSTKPSKRIRRNHIAYDVEQLTDRDWSILLTNSKSQKYKKGSEVFREGTVNKFLYRVKSGKFRVEKLGKDGNPIIVTHLGSNAMFGEMSFLGSNTTASIIAEEDSELYVLEIMLVKRLFSTDPELFETFYHYLAAVLAKRLKNFSSSPKPPQPAASTSLATVVEKDEPTPTPTPQSSQEIKKQDDEFHRRFKLPESEIVIKEHPCQYSRYRGSIFLSKDHVCFFAKLFGVKKKMIFSYVSLKDVRKREKLTIEIATSKDVREKFQLTTERERDDIFGILRSLWESSNANNRSLIRRDTMTNIHDPESEDPEELTKADWDYLLQGAKVVTYEKNQIIVAENDHYQRIYQIATGTTRIEKTGIDKVLGKMETGSTFGEISFLLSGGATANVIADSSTVEVYILEGYFLNILFNLRPELGGRFYKYLASVLQKRLRAREEERTKNN